MGLPDGLKHGVETLSGVSLDAVRVHYNSSQPAQLNARAFAQGTDIHLAPGQERHLAHEAWHVVQQAEGRAPATRQLAGGIGLNDDPTLEQEADQMGQRALQMSAAEPAQAADRVGAPALRPLRHPAAAANQLAVQRKIGFEYELGGLSPKRDTSWFPWSTPTWGSLPKGFEIVQKPSYAITADLASGDGNNLEFVTRAFDETDPSELAAARAVGESIVADVKQIVGRGRRYDVRLSELSRIGAPRNMYIDVLTPNPFGQLQMTGGVRPQDLATVMSGEGLGELPQVSNEAESYARLPLQKYHSVGVEGVAMGAVFAPALASVQAAFDIPLVEQRMLAAVVALMAQVVIAQRETSAESGHAQAGRFIAKTDFAEVLQRVAEQMQEAPGNWDDLLPAVVETANGLLDVPVAPDSSVFPAEYEVQGQRFAALSIRDWVGSALPRGRRREMATHIQMTSMGGAYFDYPTGRMLPRGTDKLTKKDFPGSQAQRNELGAYGTYGSKTDPGGKLIMEWRDLNSQFEVADLPKVLSGLFNYYQSIGI